MDLLLGIDLGGTKTIVWTCDAQGRIGPHRRCATPAGLAEGLASLRAMAISCADGHRVAGIGVTIGGPIDRRADTVSPLHQPAWREVRLREHLATALNAPVAIEVDTDGAALAEWRLGGHGVDRLLYLTISTGIGGGLVDGGRIHRGAGGAHPEVGHVSIPTGAAPERCACGAYDCLEALVSGRALERRHGRPAHRFDDGAWIETGRLLGIGLATISTCLAPEAIVLGGGVAVGGGERLLAPARDELARRLRLVPVPQLRAAGLGYASAPMGALMLAARAAGWPPPATDPAAIRAAEATMRAQTLPIAAPQRAVAGA